MTKPLSKQDCTFSSVIKIFNSVSNEQSYEANWWKNTILYILIKSESPELICIFSSFFLNIRYFLFLPPSGRCCQQTILCFVAPWGPSALLTHCLRAWFLLLKYRMSFFLIAWFLRAIKGEDEQKGGKVPSSNRTEWGNLSSLVIRTVLFHRVRWLCAETVFKPRRFCP